MKVLVFVFICCLAWASITAHRGRRRLPPHDFILGVQSTLFRTEGADEGIGGGNDVGDTWGNAYPELVADSSNANEADRSYTLYREDVQAVANMSLPYFAIVPTWSRILKDGTLNTYNEDAIRQIRDLIIFANSKGVDVHIRMCHLEVPQAVQDIGGWTNPKIISYFLTYAEVLFVEFAPLVTYWSPFEDGNAMCTLLYGNGLLYPTVKPVDPRSRFECLGNALKVQATVKRFYDAYFSEYNGLFGVATHAYWFVNSNNYYGEKAAAFMTDAFDYAVFSGTGGYSPILIYEAKVASERLGYNQSFLQELSPEWMRQINGSADVLGFTWDTLCYVEPVDTLQTFPPTSYFDPFTYLSYEPISDWRNGSTVGLGNLLRAIKESYNNPKVALLGLGYEDDGAIDDQERVEYFSAHLNVVADVINEGSNIIAVTFSTLLDEWRYREGFTTTTGLYHVDRLNQTRSPKLSANYVKQVAETLWV